MNLFSKTLILCAAAAGCAAASTIQFVGAPTGVSDGQYYVMPYQITIDGISQLVTCYDTHDEVYAGDTWQANILTLSQAAASGYFSGANSLAGYERIAWLDAQKYTTTADQIGLQHAIWNVFGSATVTAAEQTYDTAANTAAANGYAGFDFSNFRFIEQVGGVPGQKGTEQAFVYTLPSGNNAPKPTPEPGTFFLAAGLGLAAAYHYRRRKTA